MENKITEVFEVAKVKIVINERQMTVRDLQLEINSKINEHTVGKIKYLAPLSEENFYHELIQNEGDDKIQIKGVSNIKQMVEGQVVDKMFLNGVIDEISLFKTRINAVMVEITCYSNSILLDRIPRFRSFQNPDLSYSEIGKDVERNYTESGEIAEIIRVSKDLEKVPRMTIQYNETDWEYLKRIASYVGEPLIPYNDLVLLGFEKVGESKVPSFQYAGYGKSKKGRRRGFEVRGTEIYSVSTPLKLQQKTKVNGQEETLETEYYVIEQNIRAEGGILKSEYILGNQNDYFVDPIGNKEIKGAVIEARVIHIARTDGDKSKHGREDGSSDNLEGRRLGAKPLNMYVKRKATENDREARRNEVKSSDIAVMTVDLTEGLKKLSTEEEQTENDKYAGKSYFPYTTPYSQSNTGFTPAPEKNDKVSLYFPSENETHAIVLGAVNNNGNGRFTNPDKRNFASSPSQASNGGNPQNEGKPMYNFTMDNERFIVNVGSVISMTSAGTVGITGTSNVNIASTSSSATLTAAQNVDITSQSSSATLTAAQNVDVTSQNAIATLRGKTYVKAIATENAELMAKNVNVGLGEGGFANQVKVKGTKLIEIDSDIDLSANGKSTAALTSMEGEVSVSGQQGTLIGEGKAKSVKTIVTGDEVDIN